MAGHKLPKQVATTAGISNGLRTGTVAAVSSTGVTLNINGALVGPFACLDTMVPEVGDVVSVFRQDSTWLIIGRANLNPSPWTGVNILNGWGGILGARVVHYGGRSLQLVAQMTVNASARADGTNIANLPDSSMFPRRAWDIPGSASALGTQSPHFNLTTAGALNCFGYTASANAGFLVNVPLDL